MNITHYKDKCYTMADVLRTQTHKRSQTNLHQVEAATGKIILLLSSQLVSVLVVMHSFGLVSVLFILSLH